MVDVACLNCGDALDEKDSFCRVCGAGVVKSELSLIHLIRDSFSTLIDWEEGSLRTFRDLVVEPAKVIRFYWEGGRKRYVEPLRYFFIAFIVYQLYILLSDQSLFFVAFIEGFHHGIGDKAMTEAEQQRLSMLVDVATLLYFVILPVLSVTSLAAFSELKRSYAEHLVMNAYLIAQVLLCTILFDLISYIPGLDVIGVAMGLVLMGGYVVHTLKTVMGVKLGKAIAGFSLGSFLAFVLLAVFFGVVSALVI